MHRRSCRNRGLPGPKPGVDAQIQADNEALARFIVEWCEGTGSCGRPECVRSRRCRGPGVPCFEVNTEDFYLLVAESPAGKRLFEIAIEAAREDEYYAGYEDDEDDEEYRPSG